jgi:hypothetical protein
MADWVLALWVYLRSYLVFTILDRTEQMCYNSPQSHVLVVILAGMDYQLNRERPQKTSTGTIPQCSVGRPLNTEDSSSKRKWHSAPYSVYDNG